MKIRAPLHIVLLACPDDNDPSTCLEIPMQYNTWFADNNELCEEKEFKIQLGQLNNARLQ